MFTGMVAALGVVKRSRSDGGMLELEIESPVVSKELERGDSVAVSGVCLTAIASGRKRFTVQAMAETLARSTLGRLERGSRVNLELPARPLDRLGGHIVQGHVDGVARVIRREEEDGAARVWLSAGDEVLRYLVPKGSVALDGVSLTVVEVGLTSFQVALIPHTLSVTTLANLEVGTAVNLEIDVIAKHVERLVGAWEQRKQ
jgi:riboflavin synthase